MIVDKNSVKKFLFLYYRWEYIMKDRLVTSVDVMR